MRRAIAFSIAAAVVVFTLAALAAMELRRPAGWQDELIGHIARLGAQGDAVRLVAAKRAPRPDLFDGHLSRAVLGNQSYTAKPLPYPPDVLYCILLEHRRGGAPPHRQLVFAARHHDLHNADWALHESDYGPFGAELVLELQALGCVSVLGS